MPQPAISSTPIPTLVATHESRPARLNDRARTGIDFTFTAPLLRIRWRTYPLGTARPVNASHTAPE
jgi:hypothetical protein